MTDLHQVAWAAWTPTELAAKLRHIQKPWYIVGGWALDLWHGKQTRSHEDLEFCIMRQDFSTFQSALKDWPLFAATNGEIIPLDATDRAKISQFWGMDRQQNRWVFDMMIEPGTPERWHYKRDPSFSAARRDVICKSAEDIPYLNPAAILLFKAKHQRPKDDADFKQAAPKLNNADRTWLRDALIRFHPDHDWIKQL